MRRATFKMAVVFAVLSIGAPALAQTKTAAEAAFREGRALMKKGRFADACKKFSLSQRLDPGVGTLLNLAVCHEKQGKLATAWTRYNEAADLAARAGDNARGKKIRAVADRLAPRLARLEIRVADDAPESLRIERDGHDVTALVGTATPIDPGDYTLKATADGFLPWTRPVHVEGEGRTVQVTVPALKPAPAEAASDKATESAETAGETAGPPDADGAPAKTVSSSASADPGRTRRLAGLGLVAGGAASTVLGLVFGWQAMDKNDAYNKECPGGVCPSPDSRGFKLESSARKNANLANVFVGLGLAVAAGGAYLWLTAPVPGAPEPTRAARAAPLIAPGVVGASVSGQF